LDLDSLFLDTLDSNTLTLYLT